MWRRGIPIQGGKTTHIEKQITINATPEKIFQYLADLPSHSEWASHPIQIKPDSKGPIAVGSTLTSNAQMMGKNNEDHLTIQELVPNSKIVFGVAGAAGKFVHQIRISGNGSAGCQVSKSMDVINIKFPLKLMQPLLPMIGGKGLDTDLKRIKTKLEQN